MLTGSSFVLQAGGQLTIGSEEGISASGATGAIQTATRSFSSDASYRYDINVPVFSNEFTVPTGTGLPAQVRADVLVSLWRPRSGATPRLGALLLVRCVAGSPSGMHGLAPGGRRPAQHTRRAA